MRDDTWLLVGRIYLVTEPNEMPIMPPLAIEFSMSVMLLLHPSRHTNGPTIEILERPGIDLSTRVRCCA